MVRITLEDKGQDLLWLMVDDDVIINAGPYQSHIWKGAYVPVSDVRVGELCPIHHPPHINFGYLKYKVERIDKDVKPKKCEHDET